MCLIIHRPDPDTPLPHATIENAIDSNPDGYGICWLDGPHGRRIQTTLDPDRAETWLLQSRPFVFHARFATHGHISKANCHPFPLGSGRWLMHNGIIGGLAKPIGAESDSSALARLLAPLSTRDALRILSKLAGQRFALVDYRQPDGPRVHRVGPWYPRAKHGARWSNEFVFGQRCVRQSRQEQRGISASLRAWRDDWPTVGDSDAIERCESCLNWLIDETDDWERGLCGKCLKDLTRGAESVRYYL